jgi:hypothetical protein
MRERIACVDRKEYTGYVDPQTLQDFFDVLSGDNLNDSPLPSLSLLNVRVFTPTYHILGTYKDGEEIRENRKWGSDIREDFEEGAFAIHGVRSIIEARQEIQQIQRSQLLTETRQLETTSSLIDKKWLIAFGKLTVAGSSINEPNVRFLVEHIKDQGYYFTTRKRTYDHRQPAAR